MHIKMTDFTTFFVKNTFLKCERSGALRTGCAINL